MVSLGKTVKAIAGVILVLFGILFAGSTYILIRDYYTYYSYIQSQGISSKFILAIVDFTLLSGIMIVGGIKLVISSRSAEPIGKAALYGFGFLFLLLNFAVPTLIANFLVMSLNVEGALAVEIGYLVTVLIDGELIFKSALDLRDKEEPTSSALSSFRKLIMFSVVAFITG